MLLLEQVVDYLRRIKAFDGNGKPLRELVSEEFVCVDERGHWDEYYGVYPFWQFKPIEVHESRFDAIDSSLQRTDIWKVRNEGSRMIHDSSNNTVIEIGSAYGDNLMAYIARNKPKTRVILIDRGTGQHFSDKPEYLFHPNMLNVPNTIQLIKGREFLDEPDLEKRINELYHANGLSNLQFFQREITPDNIQQIFQEIGIRTNNDIYLFGHRAEGRLGYTIGLAYNQLNARFMCISLTAQEKIKPDQFPWKMVQRNLGLSDSELNGYIASVYDETVVGTFEPSKRYDYSDPAQRRISLMLKLGMAMALAREVNGEVLRNSNNSSNYNQADHYIKAIRN